MAQMPKPTPTLDIATWEALQRAVVETAAQQGVTGPGSIGGEDDTPDSFAAVPQNAAQIQLGYIRAFWGQPNPHRRSFDTNFKPSAQGLRGMVDTQLAFLRQYFSTRNNGE
jgi:hypothetical protein